MLTARQSDVFAAIKRHVSRHRRGPTLEWLCAELGTKSVGSMHKHVEALKREGYLSRDYGHGQLTPETHCPCCGRTL